MTLDRAINISDLRHLAMKRLPRMAFDFIEGGCDDEDGLAENEFAFAAYRLMPRYLVDVSQVDMTAQLAGQAFSMPLGLAPTGAAGMFRHDADRLLARASAAANVPFVLSINSHASIEQAVEAAPEHTWFQLYGVKSLEMTEDMVRRAADLGVKTLVLSVDVPVQSNRERNRRNRFSQPLRVTPSMILQAIAHPSWTLEYLRNGGLPYMGNFRPYAPSGASAEAVGDLVFSVFPAPDLTWTFLERSAGCGRESFSSRGSCTRTTRFDRPRWASTASWFLIMAVASWTVPHRRFKCCPPSVRRWATELRSH